MQTQLAQTTPNQNSAQAYKGLGLLALFACALFSFPFVALLRYNLGERFFKKRFVLMAILLQGFVVWLVGAYGGGIATWPLKGFLMLTAGLMVAHLLVIGWRRKSGTERTYSYDRGTPRPFLLPLLVRLPYLHDFWTVDRYRRFAEPALLFVLSFPLMVIFPSIGIYMRFGAVMLFGMELYIRSVERSFELDRIDAELIQNALNQQGEALVGQETMMQVPTTRGQALRE